MKKGDKLICKKKHQITNNPDGNVNCTISLNSVCYILEVNPETIYISILKNKKFGGWFTNEPTDVEEEYKRFFYPYLYDYFYTPIEIRKLKLMQLKKKD